jgi:hypothetical protein
VAVVLLLLPRLLLLLLLLLHLLLLLLYCSGRALLCCSGRTRLTAPRSRDRRRCHRHRRCQTGGWWPAWREACRCDRHGRCCDRHGRLRSGPRGHGLRWEPGGVWLRARWWLVWRLLLLVGAAPLGASCPAQTVGRRVAQCARHAARARFGGARRCHPCYRRCWWCCWCCCCSCPCCWRCPCLCRVRPGQRARRGWAIGPGGRAGGCVVGWRQRAGSGCAVRPRGRSVRARRG